MTVSTSIIVGGSSGIGLATAQLLDVAAAQVQALFADIIPSITC